MSDDTRDTPGEDEPRDDTEDAPQAGEGAASGGEDEGDPGGPFGGEGIPFDLDPNDVMRDPFGAFSKMMSNPDAMQAMQKFMSSPMARNLLSGGLNSPLLQQVMQNNPMLKSMLDQAGERAGGIDNIDAMMKNLGAGGGGGMPFGFPFPGGAPGQAPAAAQPTAAATPPAGEDEEDEEELLDEPVIELLSPPHAGAPWPDPAPVQTLGALIGEEEDDAFKAAIAELAEARLRHHVGARAFAELTEKARATGRERASDLFVCQGAFFGEVAWYAICRLEEDFANARFVPLARHALSCVTMNSGYRVPSFVNQLLAFLLEMEACEEGDLRHAVWSLSGQPGDGVEGVFEITGADIQDLFGMLAERDFPASLIAATLVALVSWKELEPGERPSAPSRLLSDFGDDARAAIHRELAALLGGQELEGVKAFHLPATAAHDLAEAAAHDLGITAAIEMARETWPVERAQREAHDGLLAALDVLWSDAEEEARAAYLDALIASDDDPLRARAYEVGAAWSPHDYLERASQDSDPSIRRWAQRELKTLR